MPDYDAGKARGVWTLDTTQGDRAIQQSITRLRQFAQEQRRALSGAPPSVAPVITTQAQAVQRLTLAQSRAAISAAKLATEQARVQTAMTNSARAEQQLARDTANAAAASDRAAVAALRREQAEQRAANAAAKAASGGGTGTALPRTFAGFTAEGALQAAGAIGISFAIPQLIAGTQALIQQGAAAQQTTQAFNELARAAGQSGEAELRALRAASQNRISDTNLQLAANRAALLGVADSADELSVLLQIASDRARKMGTNTGQAFDDLVTGLGRASPLILDNLGITVNITEVNAAYAAQLGKTVAALTEAEKKQALINAVIAQGKETLDASGQSAETNAAKLERLSATLDNLKGTAGGALADTILPTIDLITGLVNAFDGTSESILRYVDAANAYLGVNERVAQNNRDAAQNVLAGKDALAAFTAAILEGLSPAEAYAAALKAVAEQGANIRGGMDLAIAGVEGLKGALSTFSFGIRNGVQTRQAGGVASIVDALGRPSASGGQKPADVIASDNALRLRGVQSIVDKEREILTLRQRQAESAVDAQLAAVRDQQARLKEAREFAANQRIQAGAGFSEEQKRAAELRNQEILLEQQKRGLDIQKEISQAGPALPGGVIPPTPAAAIPPPAPITLNVSIDQAGKVSVTGSGDVPLEILVNGAQQASLAGAGR